MTLSLLVVDAYPDEDRQHLAKAGATPAGDLFSALLTRLEPTAEVEVIRPADVTSALPDGVALEQFDGVCWSGSTLTIHDSTDDRARRQVELARSAYSAGCASFGSCWGAQIAAAAADGTCIANPKGREFGVSRQIQLTEAGRSHPLLEGKAPTFMAYTSHLDMISRLPPRSTLLASNDATDVQALEVKSGRGWFWATQYHPEFDAHEVAVICRVRAEQLAEEGLFATAGGAHEWAGTMERLHAAPDDDQLSVELELDESVLDFDQRTIEVRNWLQRVKSLADG